MSDTGSGAVRHYAQAAFDVARAHRDIPGWQADLERLDDLLTDPEVARAFATPQLDDGRRVALAVSLAPDGLGPERLNFLKLLVLARQTAGIGAIRRSFAALVDASEGRVELQVVASRALNETESADVREALAKRLGKETSVDIRVDPGILGGLVIRQGDRVVDGSVRRRLTELREQLIGG